MDHELDEPPLPGCLIGTPLWAALSQARRDHVWDAAMALAGVEFYDERLATLPRPLLDLLARLPQGRDALAGYARVKRLAQLPPSLASDPELAALAVPALDGPPGEWLARSREPMSQDPLLAAVQRRWASAGAARPSEEQMLAVAGLIAASAQPWDKLRLVIDRWATEVPPAELVGRAAQAGLERWFAAWARSTLAAWLRLPSKQVLKALRAQAFRVANPREVHLAAASLPKSDELAYVVALLGGVTLIRALTGTSMARGPQFLADVVAATGAKVEWGYVGRHDDGYGVGLFLADPNRLIGRMLERLPVKDRWTVLDRTLFPAGGPKLVAGNDPMSGVSNDRDFRKVMQAILSSGRDAERGGLIAQLKSAPDPLFRQVAEQCVLGRFMAQPQVRPDGDSAWFVGLESEPFDAGDEALPVVLRAFGRLLAAVLPERGPAPRPGSPELRRLWWLLNRLREPTATARMMIPTPS